MLEIVVLWNFLRFRLPTLLVGRVILRIVVIFWIVLNSFLPIVAHGTVELVVQDSLGQEVHQDAVGYPIAVQTEAVSPRIDLASIWPHHAIVGPGGIRNARPEGFRQQTAVCHAKPTLAIYVKLCVYYFLAQGDLFAFVVLYGYLVGVVPAGPYDQVRILQELRLLLIRLTLHQLHPLLIPLLYLSVQLLGVAAQARV